MSPVHVPLQTKSGDLQKRGVLDANEVTNDSGGAGIGGRRKLHDSIVAVLNQPDTIERLVATGSIAQSSTPEELGAKIRKDIEYFGRIVKSANIKLE